MSTAAWQKKNGQVKKPKMKINTCEGKTTERSVGSLWTLIREIFNVKSPSIKNTKYEN